MLIEEHHISLYSGKKVISFVVEELICSDQVWPEKFRVTVKPRHAFPKLFYGPSPEAVVNEAVRYISRCEVRVVKREPSLRQLQAG
jgi:hypothetical protein